MNCAYCKEEISGKPVTQENDHYCSLECANAAVGHVAEEEASYYEEHELEGLYGEEE